ncbi:D-alanine--D-alanine ligase [Bacteroidales bacterium OttesenSCG-928-C19]|nr:D-alanine--D-alanine ligase [Bacteroidales bacterium OttesenSCG-928-C19]
MKKNIALVAGGFSGEFVISIASAKMVEKALNSEKYNVYKIAIEKEKWYYLDKDENQIPVDKNDFSITVAGEKITFDCAFIIIHGDPGENGKLQGYFDMLNIPYTTSDFYTMSLTFNKAFCNAVVRQFEAVNVARSIHIYKNHQESAEDILKKISLPCFVKPNSGGSSIGLSKVNVKEELLPAIETAFKEDNEILIEEYIKGRELTCGVLQTKKEKIVLPVTEIIPKGKEFFDFEAKYKGFSDEITPAQVDKDVFELVQNTSSKLYDLLNCKGIVRFDFIYNEENNKLFFLEVNTVPGQSEGSIVPQQARAYGMTTTELYDLLIESIL